MKLNENCFFFGLVVCKTRYIIVLVNYHYLPLFVIYFHTGYTLHYQQTKFQCLPRVQVFNMVKPGISKLRLCRCVTCDKWVRRPSKTW